MLTTEKPTTIWQPPLFNIGKYDGWKGHLPTEEYHLNQEYQEGYFAGIQARYQNKKQ